MPDAPPLSRFALGALYYSIGDHNAAVEQLGFAAEEEVLKESRHATPSRQLRRYVGKIATDRTPAETLRENKCGDCQPGKNASGTRRATVGGKPATTEKNGRGAMKARCQNRFVRRAEICRSPAAARSSPLLLRQQSPKF